MYFCSQNWKRRILATFGFNRTALRATQPKLHSMFCALFLRFTLLDYYLWDAFKDKCYADKLETIDSLKENIRKAIGEIQPHTMDNVLKNWTDRVGYASRGKHLNKFNFHC